MKKIRLNMEDVFRQTQNELKNSLTAVLRSYGYAPIKRNGFVFAQGRKSSPVLLIAHLDTVHKEPVKHICYSKDENIMMSPQGIGGDDRCGVWMVLQIIKKYKCSVLFCEDEELGCVGAEKFIKSKIVPQNINYIMEFDRRGSNDAVFYDCDNEEFTAFITDGGFIEDYGSFSDISVIAPYLGIAAVNLSCGYYNAHTQHEFIVLSEMKANINKAMKLIAQTDRDKKFEYIECKHKYKNFGYIGHYYGGYDYSKKEEFEDFPNYVYKEFMEVTEDIGYITYNGDILDHYNEYYFLGEDNRVYVYDWDEDMLLYAPDCEARTNDGGNLRFNADMAIPYMVMG